MYTAYHKQAAARLRTAPAELIEAAASKLTAQAGGEGQADFPVQ